MHCVTITLRSLAKVKYQLMYFLVNSSPPKPMDVATSNFADAEVTIVLYCIVGPGPQGQGQIMYFLVNTFPKPLDRATENFAGAYVT